MRFEIGEDGKMRKTNHTFAICAYKESPYLRECVASLRSQMVPTNIIMVTSTPNELISSVAEENGIPLYINDGEKGITQDWNFALRMAKTDYVTIAHQDDTYKPDYVKNLLSYTKKAERPLIFFSDYSELRDGVETTSNTLLAIKRIMLFPLRWRRMWGNKAAQWYALAFGDGISCPTVTYYKPNLPEEVFVHHFRSCEDWEAWERLRHLNGDFIYCSKILMSHRIHEDSETSRIIADHKRSDEEYELYRKFWPRPVAFLLTKVYALGQKSNTVEI